MSLIVRKANLEPNTVAHPNRWEAADATFQVDLDPTEASGSNTCT